MLFENQFQDNRPITRIGSVPVYGTTIVVAAMVIGLVVAAFAGVTGAIAMFAFVPEWFWKHGHVWRAVTYLIVGQVNFFTIFSLMFLYTFGRDCELEMGRGRYFAFLGVLVVTPIVVATLAWLAGMSGFVFGSMHLSIGLVIAFATMYPNVQWWGGIPMRFIAIGSLFLAAVGDVSNRDFMGLICTLATSAAAFGYIRAIRAGVFEGFSFAAFFRRKPGFRVLPSAGAGGRDDAIEDMDALLDKIAKTGLSSLTSKERSRLEAGRKELLKRDRR